ncbi:myosin-11 [Ceratitis capitata]|uniref:TRAF-interacting protein n=1 Tax=Ceratitis capitata TaxID=7213 RepID=W8AYT6_CERCA|nr:myosin-11 [Ceratitis capitata]
MPCLTCIICSEVYKNSDTLYSTSCGHIFHYSCMQQWRSRTSTCPQCREMNPDVHRIYLDFDETENEVKLNEMKAEFELTEKSRSEIQMHLDETERNFLNLQNMLSEAEEKILDLQTSNDCLKVQNDSREQLIQQTVVEYNIKTAEETELLTVKISSLEDRITEVLLEKEHKFEECLKFSQENNKLRELLNRNEKLYEISRKQFEAVELGLRVQIEHLNKEITAKNTLIEEQMKMNDEFRSDDKNSPKYSDYHEIQENSIKSSEMMLHKLKLEMELDKSLDKILELEENHRRDMDILNFEIESLKADNERKDKEIQNRKEEHAKIINNLSSLCNRTAEISLRQRNQALSKKLEDAHCKLENAIKRIAEKDIAILKLTQSKNALVRKLEEENFSAENKLKNDAHVDAKVLPSIGSGQRQNITVANNVKSKVGDTTSVVIKGIPESDIKTPLIDTILMYTEIMNIPCSNVDITDVFRLNKNFKHKNTSLVVTFSTLNMKVKFLDQKDKLKLKGIQASGYVDTETNQIFHYAKVLKTVGYQQVFCKNNTVFVKRNFKAPAIEIKSKEAVDNMMKNSNDNKNDKNKNGEKILKEPQYINKLEDIGAEECDDEFYRKRL